MSLDFEITDFFVHKTFEVFGAPLLISDSSVPDHEQSFVMCHTCGETWIWTDNFFQGLHFIFNLIYVHFFPPQTALAFYHVAHFPYFNLWLSLMCLNRTLLFPFVLLFGRGVTHISNSFEMEMLSLNCAKQQKNECKICSMFCSCNNLPLALREFLVLSSYQKNKIDQQNIAHIIFISCSW